MFSILLSSNLLSAQVRDRIAQPMQASEGMRVRGNVHPLARAENDDGEVAPSMMLYRMAITFNKTATQQLELEALLEEQQNPSSPSYHQWLTPEQFADRFGLSSADINKVADWLNSQGFTVNEIARSRTYIAFSGSASQVESAFGASIHRYMVSGEMHYANATDPVLPWPLANVAIGIQGLHDFRPQPRGIVRPRFTSSISGSHFLAPDDFATIYNLKSLYSAGIDGTGQKIAVAGQSDLIMSDITTFRSVSGLPANNPTVVLVPGSADPGVRNGDIGESDLDVEWSGAVARNATIVYVNSTNAFNSMTYAVSQGAAFAPVISISYGDCEPDFAASEINSLVAMGQQANAQGQTIVGPAGDSGAADCDFPPNSTTQVTSATHGLAVDVPASLPYVTGAGGTTFNEGAATTFWSPTNNAANGSALMYIPETAWNDTTFEIAHGGSLAASGGGVSTLFPKPSWQTGNGVPADNKRDVPDISFNASFNHDGYLLCSQGNCVNGYRDSSNNLVVAGGTSAGAPVFAAVVALINQKMGTPQGNVNPRLYALAASSPNAFHDVTTGDNKVPCTAGSSGCPAGTASIGFSAGAGYDLVTGLGSVDTSNLVTAWAGPDFMPSVAPASLNLTAGPTNNVGTSTVTVSALNGFSGTITFACRVSSNLPNTSCTVSPTSLANSGSVTLTVTAPATRASLRAPRLFPHLLPWTDGSFAVMGLLFAGARGRGSKKKQLAIVAVLLMVVVGMMAGCGGGGSSSSAAITPVTSTLTAATGTVSVTATSGAVTRTSSLLVTVN